MKCSAAMEHRNSAQNIHRHQIEILKLTKDRKNACPSFIPKSQLEEYIWNQLEHERTTQLKICIHQESTIPRNFRNPKQELTRRYQRNARFKMSHENNASRNHGNNFKHAQLP
jgi:hypothetical protein